MISAVAFVPQAPLLVPALTGDQTPELAQLRAACRVAISRVGVPGRELVVVGSGASDVRHASSARGSLAGFGVPFEVPLGSDEPGRLELPPSLSVGAWLVRDALGPDTGAVGYSVAAALPKDLGDGVDRALVVVGDGAVRRTENEPSDLDERAARFDGAVADALRTGAAQRWHLGPEGRDSDGVQSDGRPVWAAVAVLIEACEWDADLLYAGAPFGVGYFVAVWTRRD